MSNKRKKPKLSSYVDESKPTSNTNTGRGNPEQSGAGGRNNFKNKKPKVTANKKPLTANKANRVTPTTPKKPSVFKSVNMGRAVGAGSVFAALGAVGSQIDKSGMQALRSSQRYLKANPMKQTELGPEIPGKSYMGRATWKSRTALARKAKDQAINYRVPTAGSTPPVKTMKKRPSSSPVAKSKFEQNMSATFKRIEASKTVNTHAVDKMKSGAMGSGGPQKSAMSFKDAFGAARKAHGGAGGVFSWGGKDWQTNIKGEKYVAKPKKVKGHYNKKKKK